MKKILTIKSISTIGTALEANLIEQVKFYGTSPLVNLYDENNMVRIVTGLPISIFNLIAGTTFTENDIDHKIELALKPFKKQKVPMIWWVGPTSTPRNLGTYLEKHGLEKSFDMLGMFYDLEKLENNLNLPPSFIYYRVDTNHLLRLWTETQTEGFEANPNENEDIFRFEKTLGINPNSRWVRFIGFIGEKPVGVSILFLGAGVAAIFNVAVVPKFRRRGIGTLMTKIPLLKARSLGYKYGVLKASPLGAHLYKHLNFKECCKIGLYYLPIKE
ncbi:MAG: GNAT family N-acetyltransferase [Candidatus Hodarchaeota archaeon]